MANILITGAAGFVGRHLSAQLHTDGLTVFGMDLRPSTSAGMFRRFFQADLGDIHLMENILAESRPAVVFHLAGALKSPDPLEFFKSNCLGTVSLLEAIRKAAIQPTVIIASSSAVYGSGAGLRPIGENSRLRPMTPYAISKAVQEALALHYHTAYRLPVLVTRTFNLLGPGLSADLACSAFARQIALAEAGKGPAEVVSGALGAQRDFVDVRDAARAYSLLAQRGSAGRCYNVCSGQATSIQECLELLLEMTRVNFNLVQDPERLQNNDIPVQRGDPVRLQRATGWQAEIPIRQSLQDLLNEWRERIRLGLET